MEGAINSYQKQLQKDSLRQLNQKNNGSFKRRSRSLLKVYLQRQSDFQTNNQYNPNNRPFNKYKDRPNKYQDNQNFNYGGRNSNERYDYNGYNRNEQNEYEYNNHNRNYSNGQYNNQRYQQNENDYDDDEEEESTGINARQTFQQNNYKRRNQDEISLQEKQNIFIQRLINHKIYLSSHQDNQYTGLQCPYCSGGRKGEKTFSIRISDQSTRAVVNCFRASCAKKGFISYNGSNVGFEDTNETQRFQKPEVHSEQLQKVEEGDEVCRYFRERNINFKTLSENKVKWRLHGGDVKIAFQFFKFNQLVNVKYRSLSTKRFHQEHGCEQVLYGHDTALLANDMDYLIIVEGEIDALSFYEIGFKNVVSLPSANFSKSKSQPQEGQSFKKKNNEEPSMKLDQMSAYLESSKALFDTFKTIIIATDNDVPGQLIAEELSKRVAKNNVQVLKVAWPNSYEDSYYFFLTQQDSQLSQEDIERNRHELEKAYNKEDLEENQEVISKLDSEGKDKFYRKDANEVLVKDGAAALEFYLSNRAFAPKSEGVHFYEDYAASIFQFYISPELYSKKVYSCGWEYLDPFYRVALGELTVVTGVPGSGKSEFIDNLLLNLAQGSGLKFAICSFEKSLEEQVKDLVEKKTGKIHPATYHNSLYEIDPSLLLEKDEYKEAADWVGQHFCFIKPPQSLPSIQKILEHAELVMSHGYNGLVIDPYNELEHQRDDRSTETKYVSEILSLVKQFAQKKNIHVWFVAHPRQLHDWQGRMPSLYDISGSAHWNNKADVGLVIHRTFRDSINNPEKKIQDYYNKYTTLVSVEKVRNKQSGKIGRTYLEYSPRYGTYNDKHENVIELNKRSQKIF